MHKHTLMVALLLASLIFVGPARAGAVEDCAMAALQGHFVDPHVRGVNASRVTRAIRVILEMRRQAQADLVSLQKQRATIQELAIFVSDDPLKLLTVRAFGERLDALIKAKQEDIDWYGKFAALTAREACERSIVTSAPPFIRRPPGTEEGIPPVVTARPPTSQPPPLRQPPIDHGTSAVIQMEGEPAASPTHDIWISVAPGRIESKAAGSDATYTWNELPQTIGPEGFDLVLKVVAHSVPTQSLNTGIGVTGLVDFVKSATDNTPVAERSVPAVSSHGQSAEATITVHIKPLKAYSPGQDVTIEVGAFYGPNVVYHYKPLRTGQ